MTQRRTAADLWQNQREMIAMAKEKKRVCWFSETGTGKAAAIGYVANRFLEVNPTGRVLICSYRAVVRNVYAREFDKWEELCGLQIWHLWEEEGRQACLRGEPGVYLANWERIPFIFDNAEHMRPFGMIAFDESSALKDRTARRTKQAMALSKTAKIVILADGTARSYSAEDLWSQLKICRPDYPRSHYHFKKMFVEGIGLPPQFDDPEEALVAEVEGIARVWRAKDVLDLPPLVRVTRTVTLPESVWDQIADLEAMLQVALEDEQTGDDEVAGVKAPIALVQKIGQFLSGVVLSGSPGDPDRKQVVVHERKFDSLERLVAELNGEPLMVAIQWRATAAQIVARIPGAVFADSGNIGDLMPDWVAGRIPVLVMHPASLGHGVDGLQDGGHHFCFFDQPWSPAKRQQAVARLNRGGQSQTVFVHDIVAAGTENDAGEYCRSLDEICLDRALGKISAEKNFLQAVVEAARRQPPKPRKEGK